MKVDNQYWRFNISKKQEKVQMTYFTAGMNIMSSTPVFHRFFLDSYQIFPLNCVHENLQISARMIRTKILKSKGETLAIQ